VIDAAIGEGVKKVIAISTDKAVNPVNLYGATKLCSEKLFTQGNTYAQAGVPSFSCARYGNVVGSRGSVVPVFLEHRKNGKIPITDSRMTRFWITLEQGVEFVVRCIEQMRGGEIYVPKIPSMNIMQMAEAVAPGCEIEHIGIRPGEKLHEVLVSEDEARNALELDDMFVIRPSYSWWTAEEWPNAAPLPDGFRFSSDANTDWLSVDQLRALI